MTSSVLPFVMRDLDHLIEYAPDLAEAKVPGTRRPWSPPLVSADKRAERAARDRLERDERERDNRGRGVVVGFTAAPVHVDVLDDLVDLNMTAAEILEALVRYVPTVLQFPTWSMFGDPRPMLREAERLLPIADAYHPDITEWVETKTKALCTAIDRALALLRHGTTLTAVCPFCRGVDPHHPAGGALTLRVEQIGKGRPAEDGRPAVEESWAVVCHGECNPPADKVGAWHRGHPAWPQHEWDWLAPQLLTPEDTSGRLTS